VILWIQAFVGNVYEFARSILLWSSDLTEDLPCFLSHSVADRLGPCCLFGGAYVPLSFGGLRPLVDGSVG
jgi:hypothetical protein